MACMCGNICCPSCGPAQGNSCCALCGKWSSEGCQHYDENTGEVKPEFQKELNKKLEENNKLWEELFREEC